MTTHSEPESSSSSGRYGDLTSFPLRQKLLNSSSPEGKLLLGQPVARSHMEELP